MWKASTSRVPSALARVSRRSFSVTQQKLANEGKASGAGTAAPPPPQPPKLPPAKKGGSFLGTLFKLLSVATVGAGGAVGYAYFDPNFRKQLEDNVPYSKEAMDVVFEMIPAKKTTPSGGGDAPYLGQREDKPLSLAPPKEEDKFLTYSTSGCTCGQPRRLCQCVRSCTCGQSVCQCVTMCSCGQPRQHCRCVQVQQEPCPPSKEEEKLAQIKSKAEQKRQAELKMAEKEREEAAENAALEVNLENVTKKAKAQSDAAVCLQQKLTEAIERHTRLLRSAMEDSSDILNKDRQWQAVAEAFRERDSLAREARAAAENARGALTQLQCVIDDGRKNKVTRKNQMLYSAQECFNVTSGDMRKSSNCLNKAEADSRVMIKYKDLIESGRKQFAQELDSLMPEVRLGNKGKKLTEEELNALIAHAHRRVEQLQRQLAEQMAMEAVRIERALEQQKCEDEKLCCETVSCEAERLRQDFCLEKEKWDAEARVEFEKELRIQLARQAAAHSDHLQDVLRVQATELDKQCHREIHTQLLQERQCFQSEVAGWIARLKGIESAVEARAESEKIARVAQNLWLCCIALNGAIRHGNEKLICSWEDRLKPLRKEVEAISDAGGKHPFVETMIMNIPCCALDRGVWTEDTLKERFGQVNKVCRRVAMVDETGGTLFRYFLSYVQSMFIVNSAFAKHENDCIDTDKLDTFSILGHAEYWLEKGDLEQAVRFMNQLTGASRRVACDWLTEAKLLLETRQAAHALTAFASASGLGTIF